MLATQEKRLIDFQVAEKTLLNDNQVVQLKLQSPEPLPDIRPGQFAEVRIDRTPEVFLRRPISINFVEPQSRTVWMLVQMVGHGTRWLSELPVGATVNLLLPLGNSFTLPAPEEKNLLLVGGGAGQAPMLFLSKVLKERGFTPHVLVGARTAGLLMQQTLLRQYATLFTTTEDGSQGEKGFVTDHPLWTENTYHRVYCCGPMPMMKAVASLAKKKGCVCEVSIDNKMACGLGACLCCVENTTEGHVCVCKDGPVFNINQLLWQI